VENSPYCIHEIDREGKIMSMNRVGLQMTGRKLERDIIGVDYLDTVSITDRSRIKKFLEYAINGIPSEFEFTSVNGKYYQSSFMPITRQDGHVQRVMGITIDITGRKRAEEALDNTVSLLHATMESTTDGILVVNRAGRIVNFNQHFIKMWKIPPYIVSTRDDSQALSFVMDQLKDPDRFLGKVQELYDHPEEESFDILEFRDGRTFERYSQPQRVGDQVVGRVWSFRDIAERKKAEQALQESEERFRIVAKATNDAVWDWDLVTNNLWWNEGFHSLFGYAPEETEPDIASWYNHLHPEDWERVKAEIHAAIDRGDEIWSGEYRFLRKDGAIANIFDRGYIVRNATGKAVRMIGAMMDTTERKKAEQALKESEEKFYKAFDSSPDSMVINRLADGRLINVNAAFEKIVGYSREEAVGRTPVELDIWVQPEERESYVNLLKEGKSVRDFEVIIRRKDGAIRTHKLSAETFVLGGETCIVSIGVDITEQKNEQQRLQRSLRALRVLSSCNEVVTKITDEQQLLESVCRIAVEQGNYRFAWVGYPQTDAVKTVLPMAHAGYEAGYLNNLITWAADDVRGQGPIGRVIRSKKKVVVRNIASDPTFKPWQKQALARGYASGLALPLKTGDEILGAFIFYSTEEDAFDVEEVKLLEELADNLSMGVHNLRTTISLEQTRQEVDRQYHELDLLYNTAPVGFALLDTELRFVRVNKVLADAHQLTVEDHYGRKISDIKPEFAPILEPLFKQILATGEPVLDREIHEKISGNGGDRYWLAHFVPLKIASGEIIGINLMLQNITERKRTEELLSLEKNIYELITSENRLTRVLDSICTSIEKLLPGSLCSILLLDAEQKRLFHGAAPSLAEEYIKAVNGIAIGPHAGSCGTAAFRNERVIVSDINNDPLWADCKDIAAAHGLQACWSTPIRSSRKEVLGTFAIYYHDNRSPAGAELDTIDRMCHLGGMAIERDKAEASLRLQYRALESAVDPILITETEGDYPIIYCNPAFERASGYTRKEVLGKNPRFLQGTDCKQSGLKVVRQALAKGAEARVLLRNYRKDGTMYWNELHLAPVRDGNDNISQWIGVHNDITSSKLAKETLAESEDKFSKAFRALPDPLIIARIDDGAIIDVNDSFLDVTGYPREEVIGENVYKLGVWNDPEQRARVIDQLVQSGRIRWIEADLVKKNGENANCQISGETIWINNIPHMLLLTRDVTLHKKAEKALQHKEKLLSFLYEENPSMYFTVSPGGTIKAVNTFGAKELGYTVDELIGQPVFAVFSLENHVVVQQQLNNCLEQPGAVFEWEIIKICKDGRPKWVKETAVAARSPDGEIVILIVCRDISKRKQTEEELRFAQFSLDRAADSIYWTGPDGNFIYVNDSLVSALGYSRKELLSTNLLQINPMYKHKNLLEKRWKMLRKEKVLNYETQFLTKYGQFIPVEIIANYLCYDGKEYNCAIARDITERKKAQQALQKNQLMLTEAQRVASLGGWELNLQDNELTWSDEVFQIFEIGKNSFGASWEAFLEAVHPDDREFVDKTYKASLSNKTVFDIIHRLQTQDGGIKYVNEKCETQYDRAGKPLRSIGTTLDVTKSILAQKELEERANQQNFIAELGKQAITETEIDVIFETAVAGIARILKIDFVKILQLTPDGKNFLLRSGVGWQQGLVGAATVGAGLDSQAGYTLLQQQVIVVKDLRKETRFQGPLLLTDHGVISGVSTVIQGTDQPFGVLGVHTGVYREFSQNDIDFIQSIAYVLTETINRLNARNTILQSREELRNLTQRLHKIREEERTKISREIHDDLGQRLTAMKMDLSWINKHIPKNNQTLVQRLEAMISLTDSTLDITRKIALELRPAILDDLGLVPAIEWELQQFAKRSNCSYTMNLHNAQASLDRNRTITIFRILQEALTNIIRHAQATHVVVTLTNDNDKALLSISDNGVGVSFDKLTDKNSLGIMSMRERAGALGGTIKIKNGKDGGTVISLEIPLH